MDNNKTLTLLEVSEAAQKRVAVISREFTDGFEFVKNYPRSVTFFGSARNKEGEFYYEKARKLAGRIAKELRYTIVTGGGPGIMEAANRGGYEAGGNSVGLNIELPSEQVSNNYLTDKVDFHYFFSRKVCLSFSAEAYIFFPGGFGTLDEFTEILTLVQTKKIPIAPLILVGETHWRPLEGFFKDTLVKESFINAEDLSIYTITDNDDEIIKIIKEAPIRMGEEFDKKSEEPAKRNGHGNKTVRLLSEFSKRIRW
jgi:uncharacterized protein (TIGR00730 family)